jgi:hypothetical protein
VLQAFVPHISVVPYVPLGDSEAPLSGNVGTAFVRRSSADDVGRGWG